MNIYSTLCIIHVHANGTFLYTHTHTHTMQNTGLSIRQTGYMCKYAHISVYACPAKLKWRGA